MTGARREPAPTPRQEEDRARLKAAVLTDFAPFVARVWPEVTGDPEVLVRLVGFFPLNGTVTADSKGNNGIRQIASDWDSDVAALGHAVEADACILGAHSRDAQSRPLDRPAPASVHLARPGDRRPAVRA